MKNILLYPIGSTSASRYAMEFLTRKGIPMVDHPTPDATHLLLDVPSFGNNGQLRGGGDIERILERLPQYITVIGGNLDHPALEDYRTMDLLQDEMYLAQNAAITAECALQAAAGHLTTTFSDSPALVIGWGRIGKCLGQLLKALGSDVTIASQNPSHRAMAQALGFSVTDPAADPDLSRYRILFNTAPAPVFSSQKLAQCKNCALIDLASKLSLLSDDVIWARGLPAIHAPETSGNLIGQTVLRRIREGL